MKYTEEEKMNIGKRIATKEISSKQASIEYNLALSCVQGYARKYKEANGLPLPKRGGPKGPHNSGVIDISTSKNELDLDLYMSMSKEELINELIKSKANELRAKKGYEVKGDGQNKVFSSINNKNSK